MLFDASDDLTNEDRNVKRNELLDNRNCSTTYAFLVSFYSCGIVAGFDEPIPSESPRRVLRHLIQIGKFHTILYLFNHLFRKNWQISFGSYV